MKDFVTQPSVLFAQELRELEGFAALDVIV